LSPTIVILSTYHYIPNHKPNQTYSGEFEISKDLFFSEDAKTEQRSMHFRRMVSHKPSFISEKIFMSESKNYDPNQEIYGFIGLDKEICKVSVIGQFDVFGMVEPIVGCPYRFCSARCVTNTAEVWTIDKTSFFKHVGEKNPKMIDAVNQKIKIIKNRIEQAASIFIGAQQPTITNKVHYLSFLYLILFYSQIIIID
jgi:hypothetical protein